MKIITIVTHGKCVDGLAAAWAALSYFESRKHVEYDLVVIHADHENEVWWDELKSRLIDGSQTYFLDFSPKEHIDAVFSAPGELIWLDHHASSFRLIGEPENEVYEYSGNNRYVMLDNSKSGALLASEYFGITRGLTLTRMIDDADRWANRIPGAQAVVTALYEDMKAQQHPLVWFDTVVENESSSLAALHEHGESLIKLNEALSDSIVEQGRVVTLGGVQGLGVETNREYYEQVRSLVGAKLAAKSGTFGAVWTREGDLCLVSLRSWGGADVAALAALYGGGGHKQASGFVVDVASGIFD